MGKFSPKQITLDLDEYQAMLTELTQLKTPATADSLTEVEHQEAIGILLVRSIQNPGLFRNVGAGIADLELGKYKAIFAMTMVSETNIQPKLLVKFVRT